MKYPPNAAVKDTSIMITVLPVIVLYLICQKYIIDGVVAGAVKG